MLEKTTHINLLYDFYRNLLTEKQQTYLELYYHDNLSLGEIAEQVDVSRQAVNEHIKRGEQLLDDYENKLQLSAKHKQRKQLLQQLVDQLDQEDDCHSDRYQPIIQALQHVD